MTLFNTWRMSVSHKKLRNLTEYMTGCIGAFAVRYSISNLHAYEYLNRYGAIEFLEKFYDMEHTQSIEDTVNDCIDICKRNGGDLQTGLYQCSNMAVNFIDQTRHDKEKQICIELLTADMIQTLIEVDGMTLREAMDTVYLSDTFTKIENERTGLYYQSTVYVMEYLYSELKNEKL